MLFGRGEFVMRLFYVSSDRGISLDGTKGASVHLRSLALQFDLLGIEVVLFTARNRRAFKFASNGIKTETMEGISSLRGEATRHGMPDVVLERYSLDSGSGLGFAREIGCPFALEVNAPLVQEATAHRPESVSPLHAEMERELFCCSDLVITVSEPLRSYVASVRGTDSGTVVVRNGSNPKLFWQQPNLFRSNDAPVLVFLGHPKPWHGAKFLVEVLKEVQALKPQAKLVIVGGGPGAEQVRQRAIEGGLESSIQVTGPVPIEEAAKILLSGSISLAPYPALPLFYFCPLKVIDSMMAGVPVVTTAQGDLPEIVGDGGICVSPDDPMAFLEAVMSLVRDPGLARDLGKQAKKRAFQHLTWEKSAREIEGLFSRLVGREHVG